MKVSHVVSWQLHMPKISPSVPSNTSRTAGQDFFIFLMPSLNQLQCKDNNQTVVTLTKSGLRAIWQFSTLRVWSQAEWFFHLQCFHVTAAQHIIWHAWAQAMWWYKSFEELLQTPQRACCWDFFIEVTSFLLLAHIPLTLPEVCHLQAFSELLLKWIWHLVPLI